MDLHSFCVEMGFDAKAENQLFPHWEKLYLNTTSDMPHFMKADFYEKYYPLCQGPENVVERMHEVSRITAGNPVCARYANMLHYGIFQAAPAIPMGGLPLAVKFFGENAGVFQLMVAVSCLPLIAKTQAALGMDKTSLAESAEWIGGTIGIYAAAHEGIPGHTLGQTSWLRLQIDGKLFRIGRLEYLTGSWLAELPAVYRNRKDASLAVLCRDLWTFDKNGFRVDSSLETPFFTARLKVLDHHVTGTPITPYGQPQTGRKVTLDLNEWEELCAPWELIPSVHIPGGGGMTPEAVKQSLLDARIFFRKYFSTDVKAFLCCSWIFNPVWEKELPKSNLTAFQKNVYLGPALKTPYSPHHFFIYGRSGDVKTFQRTSSLHEACCRIAGTDAEKCVGTMFILSSDLEKFGTEYYRKNCKI